MDLQILHLMELPWWEMILLESFGFKNHYRGSLDIRRGTLTMNTGGNISGTEIMGLGNGNVNGNSGTSFIKCVSGDALITVQVDQV